MNANVKYRRKQFSSCDACRKSRVACDALQRAESGLGTCSRCADRNRRCSFEWMKAAAVSAERSTLSSKRCSQRRSPPAASPASAAGQSGSSEQSSPTKNGATEWAEEALLDADVSDWLQAMYDDVFESVFGSWLGNYSCPFAFGEHGCLQNSPKEQPNLSLSISIASLCRKFDGLMKDLESHDKDSRTSGHCLTQVDIDKEREIEDTLRQAIRAFSARWLPLTVDLPPPEASQIKLIQNLWRDLRRCLPKSMNRPCYRSMLTLYLFSMVPIPVGIPEEEEEVGIPAQVCVQAALQQVQYLRARQRSLEFNGSKVSHLSDQAAVVSTTDRMRTDFMTMESMIYWAALTFDTSSSLTFNTRPVLSSGLLGWEKEASWRMVKTCSDVFYGQSEEWRLNGVIVTEETANQIIAAAQAFKLRLWKVGTILKEALREGHEEDAVHHAYTCAVETVNQFNLTYRSLLMACERRLQFLSQLTKLRWYILMMHHNLCILIIIDAVETARRMDILDRMRIIRSEAEGCLMSTIEFGLSNQFTIPKRNGNGQSDSPRSFPLIAVDPYPHHVVAAVQLLWKGLDHSYESGKLEQGICKDLQSTLLQALQLLPQTSKSVRKATEQGELSLSQH